ncbi:ribonuclease HI [Afipia carboxidovorans]|nr:ribonuclease HI [Afipia carboxidovorans]
MLEAHGPAGELLRFRFGLSYGAVSRRKNGSLTLSGEASQHFINFRKALAASPAGEEPKPPRVATITTLTLPVVDHACARERLAKAKTAIVYTDGSAERGGKGRGGWAAIIRAGFDIVEIFGGAEASTINRMEIIAAVVALEILPAGCVVKLHTDSKYLRNGITNWIDGWKRNGWLTVAREPVKNEDLWRRLDAARLSHTVTWKWVKAHVGIRLNERADELAKFARHNITKGF